MGVVTSMPKYLLGINGASGFGSSSTAAAVARANADSIHGRTFIVTGANSGLGKETARVLALNGARVVLACRSVERGEAAAADLRAANAHEAKSDQKATPGELVVMELDLGSFESIRRFAADFKSRGLPAHGLICNAGVMAGPREETQDGLERQIGTNHFGHFLLCQLMLPLLLAASGQQADPGPADAPPAGAAAAGAGAGAALPSRIVVLSSTAHAMAMKGLPFDDLDCKAYYNEWVAYGNSKLANILFVKQLAAKLAELGLQDRIIVNACHPGVIQTELQRSMNPVMKLLMIQAARPVCKSEGQGAATTVFLATDPQVGSSGQYYADCNVAGTLAGGIDEASCARLWQVSEERTGERFPLAAAGAATPPASG